MCSPPPPLLPNTITTITGAVKVQPHVTRPRYDWPDGVSHASVGKVISLGHDGRVTVTFEECRYPDRAFVFQLKVFGRNYYRS
jgi:hypothetical protein